MRIVVDASVAVKWVVNESDSAKAAALQAEALVAPPYWLVEASNALWRMTATGEMSVVEAQNRLRGLQTAPVAIASPDLTAAFELACRLNHPIYDCLYLALAIAEQSHVVTADARFHRVVSATADMSRYVKLLSDMEFP